MKKQELLNTVLVSLAISLSPSVAYPQSVSANPTLTSDWAFTLGMAFSSQNPTIGLGMPEGRSPRIDLDTLGVDSNDRHSYARIHWQGLQRWRFTYSTYVAKVGGGRFTDEELTFGDIVIPEGSGVAVDVRSRFRILSADYSVWRRPAWEAGVGFGVYTLDWTGGIGLREGSSGQVVERETGNFIAPLPALGLLTQFAFSDRVTGRLRLDWLRAEIGKIDGGLWAYNAAIDWWFTDHWGMSIEFQNLDVRVTVNDRPFSEFVDANWKSAFLSLNYAF